MLQIIWHKEAEDAWYDLGAYCSTFGRKSLGRFIENIQMWVNALAQNPNMGQKEHLLDNRTKPYRSIVVHKNCKIIYYVEGDTLHIADLWDTRREPRTLTGSLK